MITAWNLWPDPYLLKRYDNGSTVLYTTEKTPDGHNTIIITGRDNMLGYKLKAWANHTYRFEFTGKSLQGDLPVGGGFWGYDVGTPFSYTQYYKKYQLIKDLGNGWGVYRKEYTPTEDSSVRLYFQLEQSVSGKKKWLIGDIHVCDLTEMGGAISKALIVALHLIEERRAA